MGELILVLLLGGAALGYGLWSGVQGSRNRLQAWKDAAAACGLEIGEASALVVPRFEARAGRLQVQIGTSGDKGQATQVILLIPGPPDFRDVRIRPQSFVPFAREIEVGEKSFDSEFFIEGPAALVLALLDAETRRLLSRLNAETRLSLDLGGLRAEMSNEKLPGVLPLLLDVGQRFVQPMDIPRRLAENARHDPEAGVRLQNLLLLIREYPENPHTVEALRTSCLDLSPEIRLRAAKELGAEGRAVLLKLAEGPASDTVSAEAVSILDKDLPLEDKVAILDRALRVRRLQTAHVCLEALGRGGDAAVDPLAKVLEREKDELAVVAAQALGATGSPAAEPPLILALQRENKDLQVAAAKALGRVGSVGAVLPLKEAAESSLFGLQLRQSARQAIAEIQSRLQGASPGQLSLSGSEAGQLSLAQAEVGQLSIATDQEGQLSISGAEETIEEA